MTYKMLLYTVIVIALYLEIFAHSGFQPGAFLYFTVQSNMLVALHLLLSIVLAKQSRVECLFRGITLYAIIITGIIYNFVLYKIYLDWGTPIYSFSRTITHLVSPIGFFLDWLLFDSHGRMKWKDLLTWAVYPLAYCLILLAIGSTTGFSLYSFLDTSHGYIMLIKRLGYMSFGLLIVGVLTICLDKILRLSK